MDKYFVVHSYGEYHLSINRTEYQYKQQYWEISKATMSREKSQTQKVAYSMIPFIRCSGKGKIIETKSDQWLLGVGVE